MANFGTALTKVSDLYFPLIQRQLDSNGIIMCPYTKQCVLNAIGAINTALSSKGINWNNLELDQSNISDTLMRVASLKLNASASPREVYFQVRNTSIKFKDEQGKEVTIWKKQVEMGIEGDGYDSLLARYGRDVKKVGQFWPVRENDEFHYPQYDGFDVVPPKWIPKGKGDVIRVVYPILKTDDTVEFYIAEKDDVLRNILAHINNNLMNETFGICAKRHNATPDQKKQIRERKSELMKKAKELGLDCLDDPELQDWISPSWTEFQSREGMFIRKMRNNITKKIPKNFGNAYVEMVYDTTTDETSARVYKEIAEKANGEILDIKPEDTDETPEGNEQPDPKAENDQNPQEAEQQKQDDPPKEDPQPEKTEQMTLDACGF